MEFEIDKFEVWKEASIAAAKESGIEDLAAWWGGIQYALGMSCAMIVSFDPDTAKENLMAVAERIEIERRKALS